MVIREWHKSGRTFDTYDTFRSRLQSEEEEHENEVDAVTSLGSYSARLLAVFWIVAKASLFTHNVASPWDSTPDPPRHLPREQKNIGPLVP
jgi:hypothetical protein